MFHKISDLFYRGSGVHRARFNVRIPELLYRINGKVHLYSGKVSSSYFLVVFDAQLTTFVVSLNPVFYSAGLLKKVEKTKKYILYERSLFITIADMKNGFLIGQSNHRNLFCERKMY